MNKMKRKGILRRLAVCAVSMAMLTSATACGKPENAGGSVAVICKNEKVSFWEEVKVGAKDCCDEMGYDMLYYCASGDNDYASQIEYINDAIDKDVKAIVIAPNDPSELNEAFGKAISKGIKIVNINSRAEFGDISSCVSSSDFDGGSVAARNAVQLMFAAFEESGSPAGKVAMIGHTASTAELRLTGFKATFSPMLAEYIAKKKAAMMAAQSDASGAEAAQGSEGSDEAAAQAQAQAAAQGGEGAQSGSKGMTDEERQAMINSFFIEGERCGTQEAAYEEAKKLLDENSDIKVMYGTNTNTTLGICQAIEERDKANDIIVVGFNSDEQELKYIRTGVLDGTIIQNPYTMGYIGTRYAIQASQGDSVAGSLDTGVTWISAKNINDDDIQLLLYPERA